MTLNVLRVVVIVVMGCMSVPVETAQRATLTGKVVSVHDGDTLRVLDAAGTQHKVRLQGIDAPETKQAFGTKARNRLADLTLGKAVTVRVHGRDRYGRTLGTVEAAGQDVNRQMVADGFAWHYVEYSKDAGLARAESDARAAGRGLWADCEPMPPWEWRATEKDRKRQPGTKVVPQSERCPSILPSVAPSGDQGCPVSLVLPSRIRAGIGTAPRVEWQTGDKVRCRKTAW